mmetsp:Transcript_8613/g.16310  ORF Transcript_8613/g.16310 Transcript_8613/m.16310 type:complete len:256 (+) Transcript_8613:1109-1876(+)
MQTWLYVLRVMELRTRMTNGRVYVIAYVLLLLNSDAYAMTHEQAIQVLSNKSLVFVGDSVTRYQHISLVMFIHHELWPSNEETYLGHPNPVFANLWSRSNQDEEEKWINYYEGTNSLLDERETCDCYRRRIRPSANLTAKEAENRRRTASVDVHKKEQQRSQSWALTSENRMYLNKELNLRVSYFQDYGSILQPRGHMTFLDRGKLCTPGKCNLPFLFVYRLHEFLLNIRSIVPGKTLCLIMEFGCQELYLVHLP